MTTLAQLAKPQSRLIELDDEQKIAIYPLKLGTIAALLARHPVLIAGFSSKDAKMIVAAVLESGQDAVNDLVDAACRAEEGTAANSDLTAVDEASILTACISATLPKSEERLGKFVAELNQLLTRLGVNEAQEEGKGAQ